MSTEAEHDREAGRQLAWVLAVVSVLAIGGLTWAGVSDPRPMEAWLVAIPVGLVGLTVAAFVKPVIAIRVVSGRFTEILDDLSAGASPRIKAIAQDVRPVVQAEQEGESLEVLAAERMLSVPARRRLGVLLMLGGGIATGLIFAFADRRFPESLVVLPAGAFVAGLVLWYRTL